MVENIKDVPRGTLDTLDLVPVEYAAQQLGIEPKRLRGFMFRNGIADPIGDGTQVYGWSCKTLMHRLAVHASGGVS
jgi:hypothetical protein